MLSVWNARDFAKVGPGKAGMDRGICPGPGIYQDIKEETKR